MEKGTVRLNNYLQSKGKVTALSWIEISKGSESAPRWICESKIFGKSYGIGEGATKQAARNVAADAAMAKIEEDGGI